MPAIKCLGCGRDTNTTMCDWSEHQDLQPRECWATYDYENNCWQPGCGYDRLPEGCFEKKFVDKHLG